MYTSKKISKIYHKHKDVSDDTTRVAAWFLGPKGENEDILVNCIKDSIVHHAKFRATHYNKDDPEYITSDIKKDPKYKEAVKVFEKHLQDLRERLTFSVPFFTPRYLAHMNWDVAIPAVAGYVTAMLYNQNNVATEASTITSEIELEVGKDLCELMGFKTADGKADPWGHITSGGTVANIESLWVARNMKYMPLAIKTLLITDEKYKAARELKIAVWPKNVEKEFTSLYLDELLRLNPDLVMKFIGQIAEACFGDSEQESRDKVIKDLTPLTLQYLGYIEFAQKHGIIMRSPKVIVPASRHYSWPKGATLLGLGENSVLGVKVNEYCRMDMNDLKEKISYCKKNNYTILMVVAVMGSTAEGSCDNLFGILGLRDFAHWEEMNYFIHVDAAWGGYVRTMLPDLKAPITLNTKALDDQYVPTLNISLHVQIQFRVMGFADSVTVDPHKAGYIPYAAGAICYRNGDFRYIINMGAPYIKSEDDLNMGTYGIEGSKPGAAPVAVWLTHRTIPLNNHGYGLILGQCMFSVKRFYCQWMMLAQKNDPFVISMIHPLPKIIIGPFLGKSEEYIKDYIKNNIIGKTNEEISNNPTSMNLLTEIGPDILINGFVFNYRKKDGTLNTDVNKVNELNGKLIDQYSMTSKPEEIKDIDILIMGNQYSSTTYEETLKRVSKELCYEVPKEEYSLQMINSTILNPWPTAYEFLTEATEVFKDGLIRIINEMNAAEP
ncbi:glutamic acid decarboxylase [Oopsacas minuta]|uniref:Glutamic acid decarboxylase n=1 Tax=Oopsacas minuta TaxID=111878 RepID=A0AAV7JXQ8_9METZ|nr:glutamic acid decarboxylase [Oopsacas minuta]